MRSKAIFVALLAFAFGAQAEPVLKERAAMAVQRWVRSGRVLGAKMNRVVDMSRIRTFHVRDGISFHEVPLVGGGVCYASADTECEPIVAFVEKGQPLSEKSPLYEILKRDAITRYLLARKRAAAGQGATGPATMSPARKWERLAGFAASANPADTASEPPIDEDEAPTVISDIRVSPLLQTRWSQTTHNDKADGYHCYDFYTPMVNDGNGGKVHAPCGCTATAASQVMYYFRYPEAMPEAKTFECTVDGKTVNLDSIADAAEDPSAPPVPRPYAWDDMALVPSKITDPESPAFEAIGHLTYDVGIALKSNYSDGDTGAAPDVVGPTFTGSFGYAAAVTYWDGVSYQSGSGGLHLQGLRERTIYANLDARKPVQLGIYGYAKLNGELTDIWGGHAVVADGYGFTKVDGQDTAYVHINLGWSGSDDAWYNIPEIDTASVGALASDSSGYDFLYLGAATFNFVTDNPDEVGKEILSGRVTDEAGRPFTNAVIRVFSDNGTDILLTTDTNGIYVAYVEGGTNYDIRAEYARPGRPPELIGWVKEPVFVGRTMLDEETGCVADSRNVGNYWGADLVMAPPAVRFDGDDSQVYPDLDRALAEAVNGTRIELLRTVTLSKSVTIDRSLTIVATNDDPYASMIVRSGGADFLIANGTVFFTNVAFRSESSTPVRVAAPGVVRVAGIADFGSIMSLAPGILINDPTCFVLCGRLENGIILDCDKASQPGSVMGSWTCSLDDARATAPRIISLYGVDRAASVEPQKDGKLRWKDNSPVDEKVAVGYVDGDEPVYYRTLDRLFDEHPNGTNVVITKSGVRLEKARTLQGPQSFSAAPEAGAAKVLPGEAAGFTLAAGCELRLSGISFSGYKGNCLFLVNGEGAKLDAAGVSFSDIEGTNMWSGAVAVRRGSAKLKGSTFRNCRATGEHLERKKQISKKVGRPSYGGAIYLGGTDCTLELIGGSITGCFASSLGGGIYADANSAIWISGAAVVKGNTHGDQSAGDDDIYLINARSGRADLCLAGVLTGTDAIGVRYSGTYDGYGNDVGRFFATGEADIMAASAPAFFNDAPPEGKSIVPDVAADDATKLVWREWTPDDGQVDPSRAVAEVIAADSVSTGYYGTVEQAFAAAKDGSRILLVKSVTFTNPVELRAKDVLFGSEESLKRTLRRSGDVGITVLPGASLSVTNMTIRGENGDAGFFHVNGGALALLDGVDLSGVSVARQFELRAAGAVTVWNHGTFTMESGASIRNCRNAYYNPDSKAGYGGGVLADESVVRLRGGTITGCSACRGSGVFIGNESVLYVSGDISVSGNTGVYSEDDNICVSDDSQLYLTGIGPLTGTLGYNEGRSADTNVFGKVDESFTGTLADALASAHRFTHDVTKDVGMAVTDGDEALLVWGSALDQNGTFISADDRTYELVDGEKCLVSPVVDETTFTYDGKPKTVIKDGIGYRVVSGATATDAGDYTAVLEARPGFELAKETVEWKILPATYELTGVTFENREFTYDGTEKAIEITGRLPDWLSVEYFYNIRWDPGTNEVTAVISGSNPNYKPNPFEVELHAKLIIVDPEGKFKGSSDQPPVPPPEPTPVICEPFAFTAIVQDEDDWTVTISPVVKYCTYTLMTSDDLVTWTEVGSAEEATADGEMSFTRPGGEIRRFWKVVGKDGVRPVE